MADTTKIAVLKSLLQPVKAEKSEAVPSIGRMWRPTVYLNSKEFSSIGDLKIGDTLILEAKMVSKNQSDRTGEDSETSGSFEIMAAGLKE